MEINKIFTRLNTQKINKNSNTKKINDSNNDKISLSKESQKIKENQKYIDIVKESPDIRWDIVNKVKEKIKSGDYFNNIDLNKLADKILDPNKE